MAEEETSLPNIFGVAAAWAQLVAFVPTLIFYDNSEVEILNTDIPTYPGPVAFLGQALALALVAIGSVKKIFSTNEFAAESKKRSIRNQNPFDDPDIYFRVAKLLDRQQCVHLFVCALSVRAHNNESLTPEQAVFIKRLGSDPAPPQSWTTADSVSFLSSLHRASSHGKSRVRESTCHHAYPRCHYTIDLMTNTLVWSQKLGVKDLRTITQALRQLPSKKRFKRKQKNSSSTAR